MFSHLYISTSYYPNFEFLDLRFSHSSFTDLSVGVAFAGTFPRHVNTACVRQAFSDHEPSADTKKVALISTQEEKYQT